MTLIVVKMLHFYSQSLHVYQEIVTVSLVMNEQADG